MTANAGGTGASEPAQPALLRDLNERTVLETIRRLRGVNRAEVARQTGLSKPTVSLALRTLEDNGLVRPVAVERTGRSGILFEAVPDAALAAGIEVTGTEVRGVAVDLEGRPVARAAAASQGPEGADAVYDAVRRCADQLAASLPPGRSLECVVVGTAGILDPVTGVVTQAGAAHALDGSVPAEEVGDRLGVPVEVYNDVDLAALGERADGAARELDDFAVLWVGPGIGAALVLDGRLHRGVRGAAGEVSGVPFAAAVAANGGTPHEFTAAGPTERAVSELAARLSADGVSSRVGAVHDVASVLDAALLDDPLGRRVAEEMAGWVSWYVASIAAVVAPQMVVLSGPLGSHESLLALVQDQLAGLLHAPVQVVASKLGDASVLVGAAAVARRTAADLVFARRVLDRGPA